MKIALFTIFRVPNFGSVLQAYATQYVLEKQGHKCVTIDYQKAYSLWGKVCKALKPYNIACMMGLKPQFRKPGQLDKFIKKNIHLSKRYEGVESLKQVDWQFYDALVVGSDQVWNARYHGKDNIYLLHFIEANVNRYSLASSFALSEIPADCKSEYQRALSKFKAISVRESNGVRLVESLQIGKSAQLVLDPTLWLNGEKWLSQFKTRKSGSKDTYILLYMWTYAFEPRPYIYDVLRYWQEKLGGCKIIALEGSPKEHDSGMKIKDVADSTIPEFMALFANASLVVTSSFHGTAFALNFGRPLLSIVPDGNGDDRQSSLLKSAGAENSIVHINDVLIETNPYYDTNRVENNLEQLRKESIQWIVSNIK